MKPRVMFPDPERRIVDYLASALSSETVTVGSILPTNWGVGSVPHILVVCDGTPRERWPVAAWPTVRLVAHVAPQPGQLVGSSSEAKRLALLAQGLLLSRPSDAEISTITGLAGLLTVSDPEHDNAALASVSVRVELRSVPIP